MPITHRVLRISLWLYHHPLIPTSSPTTSASNAAAIIAKTSTVAAEKLISEARGKAETFIILHVNGPFKVNEDPNAAKALVKVFALRRPFVDLVRPGEPILTPGVVSVVAVGLLEPNAQTIPNAALSSCQRLQSLFDSMGS